MSQDKVLPKLISLEQQKKRARDLLVAHKERRVEAARRLREQLHEFAQLADEAVFAAPLTLQLCQLVLAREHGYSSWTAFKQTIEARARHEDAITVLRDAIDHDDGEATQRLVSAKPSLLSGAIFDGGPTGYFKDYRPRPLVYALQCGRAEAVKALLSAQPALATAPDEDGRYPIDLIFKPYGSWFDGVEARRIELYHVMKSLGAIPNLEAATCAHDAAYVLDVIEREPASVGYQRHDFHWDLLVMAADVGCVEIIEAILSPGKPIPATISLAIDRAAFLGRHAALKLLLPHASQEMKDVALIGCGESLSLETARLLIQHGADVMAEATLPGVYGDRRWSLLAVALTTYSRKPWRGEYIDLLVTSGARQVTPLANTTELKDVNGPVMAFFRGRFDLLDSHFERDASLVHHRFTLDEEWSVYTPINGGTLLHLAMEYLDLPMAEWLVARGADVNARVWTENGIDSGTGHTPLFQAVRANAELYGPAGGKETPEFLVAWLLERGADPNLRATICNHSDLAGVGRGKLLLDVTPLGYLHAMSDREVRRKMGAHPLAKLLSKVG